MPPFQTGALGRGVSHVPRFNIDFLGHRNIMFAISGALLAVSIVALPFPRWG
jgi:hypothetical protein